MTRHEDGRLEREMERRYTRNVAEEMREAWLERMEREAEAIEREMDRRLERGNDIGGSYSRYMSTVIASEHETKAEAEEALAKLEDC